ncbi:hypothetical protein [Ensifer adhaerens]|uniref:hypothetical protein n=1 Tax=Ensifer adhaerens TaxID=106592 RepID=UPI000CF166F4|nr:hypothetical protein [Ensifer adhaerens]
MSGGRVTIDDGIAKTVEAAELKSPDLYFTKPTPEDIQKRMQAAQPQQQPDVGMQQPADAAGKREGAHGR